MYCYSKEVSKIDAEVTSHLKELIWMLTLTLLYLDLFIYESTMNKLQQKWLYINKVEYIQVIKTNDF